VAISAPPPLSTKIYLPRDDKLHMLEGLSKLTYSISRKNFNEGQEQKRDSHGKEEHQESTDQQSGTDQRASTTLRAKGVATPSMEKLQEMVEHLQNATLYQQSGIYFEIIERDQQCPIVAAYSRENKMIQRLTPGQVADTVAQLGHKNLNPNIVRGTLVNTSC